MLAALPCTAAWPQAAPQDATSSVQPRVQAAAIAGAQPASVAALLDGQAGSTSASRAARLWTTFSTVCRTLADALPSACLQHTGLFLFALVNGAAAGEGSPRAMRCICHGSEHQRADQRAVAIPVTARWQVEHASTLLCKCPTA